MRADIIRLEKSHERISRRLQENMPRGNKASLRGALFFIAQDLQNMKKRERLFV